MKSRSFNLLVILALFLSLLGGAISVTPVRAATFNVATAPELIAAINTANSNAQNDTITLTANIVLTVADNGIDGLPIIYNDGGSMLTINGNGFSISRSSDVGTPNFRFFHITGGSTVTLQNLTFSNGYVSGADGGAILNLGTLTVENSFFISNTAEGAGAIFNYINGVLGVDDSVFIGNTALSRSGGAIYNTGDAITINGSTFTGNSTAQSGGAISMIGGDILSITNSTFANNTAATYGGGIHNFANYEVEIINTTILNNAAGDGGAVYNESGSVTLKNSLLAVDLFGMVNCGGNITAGADNIATDTTCTSATPVSFNQLKLGTLGSHGGSTQTISLLAGSPAIDHANADEASCPNEDQRGVTRDSSCDVGAYESQAQTGPDFIVNTDADTDDGSCDVFVSGLHDCTLREAINAANANSSADTITFAANYTITLAGSALPVITTEMTISGNGQAQTVIQAAATPNTVDYRVFNNNGGNLTLQDLTVSNGCSNSPLCGGGGGISNRPASVLTLQRVAMSGNQSSINGGAIHNTGTLTITDSVFLNNAATAGGALSVSGLANTYTISGSTFTGNTSANSGAAISYFGGVAFNITNSSFSGNTSSNGAGTISVSNSPLNLTNVTVTNNSGGGIDNDSGAITTTNSIIAHQASGNDCVGAITDGGNNLESATSCGFTAAGSLQNVTVTQLALGALADNGGPTQTHALGAGSMAINAGNNATCLPTDQRGVIRPQGAACDIGAFELEKNGTTPTSIFADVPNTHWAVTWIERLYKDGVTGGCGLNPLIYCPDDSVTRAQIAIFLLRGEHGGTYTPPVGTGTVFGDVTMGSFAADWIEQLAAEGITSGCGDGNYCPDANVTRAEMAIFLLRARYGKDYVPPAASGLFNDVPPDYWAAAWIEQLAVESITGGCGNGNYCPEQAITRAEMAVFLVRAFNLPLP